MKTMTCRQLGGGCDKAFRASSFDEIAGMSRQHGMEMAREKDAAHLQAMREMQELMKDPGAMKAWLERKRAEFAALPGS